ncbi:hypothetical protein M670_03523 [Schinkia azotoformans MEV2011]|uniref:Uncharacterized protein n=1 Tax=Schinkia azotoformans MEV2011 TaxID=1348973 RepID=A0A072NIE4_SCHAZ|nr:hypothetical protein [Schinkia azotoformans]KEF37276.1 hypothetical protein M670_03523 [Schinkia azotoformans MEV2011]MEC1695489.1 hypothetical protein [Schinkia azotoformans]MEC1718487.1 hypothetical protein [Schinkia azotoformans]MEC1727138.1 hypothetical protein [Schinkia azotoformans]MEC1743641.1 hypothetical protein [Schinkia azotoformans]
MFKRDATLGTGLFILLALPPVKQLMESHMVGQMIIQLPLLVLAGFFIGEAIKTKITVDQNSSKLNGVAGILLAVFTISYWMLPRAMDASINDGLFGILKYSTLPLLAGIPISLCWKKLHPLWKNFIWANNISMFAVMGWLFIISPVRLCNNYLLGQQILLGQIFLLVTALIIIYFIFCSFMLDHRTN